MRGRIDIREVIFDLESVGIHDHRIDRRSIRCTDTARLRDVSGKQKFFRPRGFFFRRSRDIRVDVTGVVRPEQTVAVRISEYGKIDDVGRVIRVGAEFDMPTRCNGQPVCLVPYRYGLTDGFHLLRLQPQIFLILLFCQKYLL